MTSPIRLEADYSYIEGEKLSPIRIPADEVKSTFIKHVPSALPPPTGVTGGHPHGLTAKHEFRRNTIHHIAADKTPIRKKSGGTFSSALKPLIAPLTSPRASVTSGSTGAIGSLSSLRKTKSYLDAKLSNNKENVYRLGKASRIGSPKSSQQKQQHQQHQEQEQGQEQQPSHFPFESSPQIPESPLNKKRNIDVGDSPLKIAKVVTNANDLSSYKGDEEEEAEDEEDENLQQNTLIRVDEVFNKEDLVGQLTKKSPKRNSPTRSPKKGKKEDSAGYVGAVVIDDDSDSDLANPTDISQTIMPKKYQDVTLSNKIAFNVEKDYITPQRLTEPIAKSPETNQQLRMVTEVEVENTTPLKKQQKHSPTIVQGYEEIEEEELEMEVEVDAENITAVENDDEKEMDKATGSVDDEGGDSDEEIVEVEEPTINFITSPNSKPVFSVDHIKRIQEENSKDIENLENVIYQKNQEILKFSEELSSTNGKFLILDQEIKELTLAKKKLIANEDILKVQLEHTERELARANKNLKSKTGLVGQFEERVNKLKTQNKQQQQDLESTRDELSKLNQSFNLKESQLKELEASSLELDSSLVKAETNIRENEKKILELTDANISNNSKIEKLLSEKESLLIESGNLKQENQELQEINSKQSSLVEELDKLETLAKDKIEALENTILKKLKQIDQLEDDKKSNQAEIIRVTEQSESLEISLKKDLALVEEKLKTNELERDHLKSKLEDSDSRVNKLNTKVKELEKESIHFTQEQESLLEQIDVLKQTNKEKDQIINSDTKKMSELVEKVNELRQENNTKSQEKDVSGLEAQLKELKQELEQINEKHQAKIQEVAELLYIQYSKKHEFKVLEVRKSMEKKFRKQVENLHNDNKAQSRDIESLEKKLDIVNMEKNQLLGLIEEYKAVAEQDSRKRSPRSPRRQKPRY